MRSKGGLFYSDEAVLSRVDAIRDSIMSSFLDDYIFIYYHDIKNNIQTVRFINDHNKTENEKNMEERDDIAETFKYIVDKYVHPEDRETVRDAIVPEKYVPMLRHKKSETIYYRWRYDDRYYLYNRLTIKKLDELDSEPTRVVITCTDVDSQVRERLMLQEIHKRYVSGVNALSREYTSVYYVNLDTKELAPFDISNRIHGLFGDRFYHIDYDRAIEEYVDNAVIDEDKERMSQILSRDYIRRNLINQDYFTRVYLNNENCYCEMKCVKVPQEDASNVVVMGFAVKDEEIRTWQKHKEQKDFQLSLLDGLTRDYHTVFLVKPGNIAELYRVTADRYSDEYLKYREAYSKGFTEGVNFYVDNYVADEDKERLRSEMVFDDLVKKVPDKGR